MRKLILLALASAALLSAAACNTVAGVGRDLTAAGGAVTDAAQSARR